MRQAKTLHHALGGGGVKKAKKRKRNLRKRKSQKKRKRKNQNPWKKNQNQSSKRTHLRVIPRAILIWMTLNDSTPTTMRLNLYHTSGKNLTKRTIPSGDAITNTPMSSLWCLCHAT